MHTIKIQMSAMFFFFAHLSRNHLFAFSLENNVTDMHLHWFYDQRYKWSHRRYMAKSGESKGRGILSDVEIVLT